MSPASGAPREVAEPSCRGPTERWTLRDGTVVRVRAVLPHDGPRIADFLAHVSVDSLERRFFSAVTRDRVAAEILGAPASRERISLIVELFQHGIGPVVAHGELDRLPDDPACAEVAFLVADDRQGQGLGTILLRELARRAARVGISRLEAVVQAENRPMLDVFLGSGLPCTITWRDGEGLVTLDLAPAPANPARPSGPASDAPLVPA